MQTHFQAPNRAQGTIEYLVIVAIIIVLGMLVVSLTTNVFSGSSFQVGSVSGKISDKIGVGGISVTESVVDSQGDAIISLANNSGENLTLTKITPLDSKGNEGTSNNFDATLVEGTSNTFSLSEINNFCPCAPGDNVKTCTFKFTFTSSLGLEKTLTQKITTICVQNVTPTDNNHILNPYARPTVYLTSPNDSATISSFNFKFWVSSVESVSSCALIIDDVPVQTISNPTRDTNITIIYSNSSLSSGAHTWDINCINVGGTTLGTSRSFTNPFTAYGTVSACGTLSDASKYYWLTQNVSGTCLIIGANNIGIDGNGFAITGDVNASATVAAASAYTGLILNNLNVTGVVALRGAANPSGNGGAGGSVTLTDSNVNAIYSSGGRGQINDGAGGAVSLSNSTSTIVSALTSGGINSGGAITLSGSSATSLTSASGAIAVTSSTVSGAVASSGGAITITNSTTGGINSVIAAGSLISNGGAVTITNSTTSDINTIGATGMITGGSGGAVTATTSTTGAIYTSGGSGSTGGSSGTITLTGTTAGALNANGGNGGTTGRVGGTVNITNSTTSTITSNGGTASGVLGYTGGAGGTVSITGASSATGAITANGANSSSHTGGNGGTITITATCPTLGNIGAFTCTYGTGTPNGSAGSCPHTCS